MHRAAGVLAHKSTRDSRTGVIFSVGFSIKPGLDFPFGGHTEQGTEQGTNELMFKERNKNNERTSFPHLWKKERNKEHPC